MLKRLRQNLGIKILCLAAATFLWVYVAASQNTVGKFPSSLKIRAINSPAGLVAVYDVKTVDIKVMADPSIWRKLSADSFSVYVDLTGLSAGTYELPVNVVSSVPGVQVVERNPGSIFISLEPIVSKQVNINKRVEGSAAEGLIAGNIDLDPEQVEAKGPKSLIDNLSEATVVVTLNGESEEFQKVATVVALDEQGEAIKSIEFVPSAVKANVPIIKASNNKTVGLKVKTTGTPKPGFFVSNITVTPSVVDITGTRTVLADVNFIETFAVDILGVNTDIEREVSLNTPSGVALQAGSPAKAKVKIFIVSSETSREIIARLNYLNLDGGLKIANVTPAEIKVLCSGSVENMNKLQSTDLVINLDLKGKAAGIFSFDLAPAAVQTPQGISVVSVVPSAISVALEKK